MSSRFQKLKQEFIPDAVDYMNFEDLLQSNERLILNKVKNWAKKCVQTSEMNECIQMAKFPEHIIQSLKQLDLLKYYIDEPYGQSMSLFGQGMILATVAQYDTGLATFIMLQAPLTAYTIHQLGSQYQKSIYLKDLIKLNIIGGWSLTQSQIGSNATQIQTNVQSSLGGYILNGDKKWIGNGNKDILIVWAKNKQNSKVEGFIVNNQIQGIKSQKIKHKLALRGVDNCIITFSNVKISLQSKLPKAEGYKVGVQKILKHSRVSVCWITVGTCIGVFRKVIEYSSNRKQFNRTISSFQLQQQKLVTIMATVQAMMMVCWRITELERQKKLTIGMVSMAKAWITERGRLVCKLGRQIMGGNGITHDNYVMKAVCDMEVLYTYEGTYDINTLVAGREITGVNAIH